MTPVIKRSIRLHGLPRRKTSVSLEEPFWRELNLIAKERQMSANALVTEIDDARGQSCNLSSAIRTFVLAYYVSQARKNIRQPFLGEPADDPGTLTPGISGGA
jgi:predicted DNA-binding ribbon-helix-helix protein